MLTRPGLIFLISTFASSGGSVGRSALISRTTSSYFFSVSTEESNSGTITATPSLLCDSIFLMSSSSLSRSSIGFTTRRSTSCGSAPG